MSLSLSEVSGEVLARFTPALGMPAPDLAAIKEAMAEQGWSHFFLDEPAVADFILHCRTAEEPMEKCIGARRDGEFSLVVDNDRMTAWLTLLPPKGGKAVAREEFDAALREQDVIYGVLTREIDAAFEVGYCERKEIARGAPATKGEPTRFESLFDHKDDPTDSDERERIRYADLSHLLLVEPGDKLMRRIPPAPGSDGTDIHGKCVPADAVPDIPFKSGLQGAEPDKDDLNLLVATLGGQPILFDTGVAVNPVIEVEDVDLGTGSIKFEGTLRVRGDVKAGMRIKVAGDVIVNGMVEAAEITAGGNVAVKGGIVGHVDVRPGSRSLPETTARIICGGSVQALFMESCHVEADKSILVYRSARQCELIAGEEIVAGKDGAKTGQIIGGRSQATLRVAAGSLGASSGVKTCVRVGFDPYLEKQIADKEHDFTHRCEEVDRVIKLLEYFRQNPKKGEGGVAAKVEATRQQLLASIAGITEELKALRAKEQLAEQARVEVGSEIHDGVEVQIAQHMWQASEDQGGGTLRLQDGYIELQR
ncbi:DUF342 domain-containing protein [Noviherbaspirillum agri]